MRILFVCTANICRSVIAEYEMKALTANVRNDLEITSAGIDADENLESDKYTKQVCSKHGLDIQPHRSRLLTRQLLDRSDIVLCLAENHKRSILSAYPQLESKVFLLRQFRRDPSTGKRSIEDPVGKSLRHYESCFREIQVELKRITPLLFKD